MGSALDHADEKFADSLSSHGTWSDHWLLMFNGNYLLLYMVQLCTSHILTALNIQK
jgi:hypothetical protein